MTPEEASKLPPPESLTPPSIEKAPLPEAEQKRIGSTIRMIETSIGVNANLAKVDTANEVTTHRRTEALGEETHRLELRTKARATFNVAEVAFTNGKITFNEYNEARARFIEQETHFQDAPDKIEEHRHALALLEMTQRDNRGELSNRPLTVEQRQIDQIRIVEENLSQQSMTLGSRLEQRGLDTIMNGAANLALDQFRQTRAKILEVLQSTDVAQTAAQIETSHLAQWRAVNELVDIRRQRFGDDSSEAADARDAAEDLRRELHEQADLNLNTTIDQDLTDDVVVEIERDLKVAGVTDRAIIAQALEQAGLRPVDNSNSPAITRRLARENYNTIMTRLEKSRSELADNPRESLRVYNALIDLYQVSEAYQNSIETVSDILRLAVLNQKRHTAHRLAINATDRENKLREINDLWKNDVVFRLTDKISIGLEKASSYINRLRRHSIDKIDGKILAKQDLIQASLVEDTLLQQSLK